MQTIQPGVYVGRKSYQCDIAFRVKTVYVSEDGAKMATLVAAGVRLVANAPLEDLEVLDDERIEAFTSNFEQVAHSSIVRSLQRQADIRRSRAVRPGTEPPGTPPPEFLEVPGTVLHLDGDSGYLEQCLKHYRQIGIIVTGYHIPEEEQPERVPDLLRKHRPDLLVLTGHDGLSRKTGSSRETIESYYNSRHFIKGVRAARDFRPEKDGLVIFAGACQSFFEAIMEAGANFASSPGRELIHCYDPVLIAEKVCYTPIGETACISDVIENTITGLKGIGGIETRGLFRLGLPAPA